MLKRLGKAHKDLEKYLPETRLIQRLFGAVARFAIPASMAATSPAISSGIGVSKYSASPVTGWAKPRLAA